MAETLLSFSNILLFGRVVEDLQIIVPGGDKRHSPFVRPRRGINKLLEDQVTAPGEKDGDDEPTLLAQFARIYGFSYEGGYYEFDKPALFLVHGDGEPATGSKHDAQPGANASRAPGQPSLTGLSAAEFQFVDDLRVWSYDKADYTIRMDADTGTFEQTLLDAAFGGALGLSGAKVSGAKVSGAKVSGAKVSGAKVSGAKVSGAKLSGGRLGDASD